VTSKRENECYVLNLEYLLEAHVLKASSPAYNTTGRWWNLYDVGLSRRKEVIGRGSSGEIVAATPSCIPLLPDCYKEMVSLPCTPTMTFSGQAQLGQTVV
jgi:hypothetical protein